jgi:hypothetical protein
VSSARVTLASWREHVADLTLAEAADAAGITVRHAVQLEHAPVRATLGALVAYVAACGGSVTILLSVDGDERRLAL